MGIDTPESRTSDKDRKGIWTCLLKTRLISLLGARGNSYIHRSTKRRGYER